MPDEAIEAPRPAKGCADGIHDQVVAGPPIPREDAVNIDYHCRSCGTWVWTESWTRDAWLQEQVKRVKQARKAQPQIELKSNADFKQVKDWVK